MHSATQANKQLLHIFTVSLIINKLLRKCIDVSENERRDL